MKYCIMFLKYNRRHYVHVDRADTALILYNGLTAQSGVSEVEVFSGTSRVDVTKL